MNANITAITDAKISRETIIDGKIRPGKFLIDNVEGVTNEINQLDLGSIVFKLTSGTAYVTWSEEYSISVSKEYRKFLTLIFKNPNEVIAPEKAVDHFWHHHILDTEKYINDCMNIFGKVSHHYPYFGLRDEDDQGILLNEFENTKRLYQIRFGNPPEGMWLERSDCG